MNLIKLPEDILVMTIFLKFLENDILAVATFGACSKECLKISRNNKYWRQYYYTLFDKKYKITGKSKHIGPQTYFRCGIGLRPLSWKDVNVEVDTEEKCDIVSHYNHLEEVIRPIRWRNVFRMCARRKYTLRKKELHLSKSAIRKMRRLQFQLESLEKPYYEGKMVNRLYAAHTDPKTNPRSRYI